MVEASVRRQAPAGPSRPTGRSAPRGGCRAARLLAVATLVLGCTIACARETPTLRGAEAGGPGRPTGTVPIDVTVRTGTGDGIRRLLLLSSTDRGAIELTTSGTSSTLSASPTGGDARATWFDPELPATVDHSACVTWTSLGENTQGGLALRVRVDDGRARAITVTNNVYLQARWIFNVHLWDIDERARRREARLEPFRHFDLRDAVLVRLPSEAPPGAPPSVPDVVDLPWRMCARVVGHVLTFKVWPTSIGEPAWDDRRHTGEALLPDEWVYPGRPGWYAGHLSRRSPMLQTDEVTGP